MENANCHTDELWTNLPRYSVPVGAFRLYSNKHIPALFSPKLSGVLAVNYARSNTDSKTIIEEHIVLALCAAFPRNVALHVHDPLDLGSSFPLLSRLSKLGIRSKRVATTESDLREILTDLRYRIAAVNHDVLGGNSNSSTLWDYLIQPEHKDSNEKLNILLINGFPYRWNDQFCQELIDIARTGSRAGVICILNCDAQLEISNTDLKEETFQRLLASAVSVFSLSDCGVYLTGSACSSQFPNRILPFFPYYPSELVFDSLLRSIESSIKLHAEQTVSIVESVINERMLSPRKSVDIIKIPIGRKGDGSLMEFELSRDIGAYHALVGGSTGSGKTYLLHNLIINGSYLYSPDELQFCLLDYKEGTEFQAYEKLPNVRIVAIESELEFGLSFLTYVRSFISERGKLFKEIGVANISDARQKSGLSIPRILIVIDEFQVLLQDSFRGQRRVAELLDDITKRGRSFGIHLVLSSQSLASVGLKTSTLSQIPLRLVLRVTRDDSERFLTPGNFEPSTFKKYGQAVLNSRSGAPDANEYFNVADTTPSIIDKLFMNDDLGEHGYSLDGRGIPKRVFDPSVKIIQPNIDIGNFTEYGNIDLLVGEPFYMSSESFHSIDIKDSRPSHCMFGSIDSNGMIEFCISMLSQLLAHDHTGMRITVLAQGDIKSELLQYFGDQPPTRCRWISDEDSWISYCSEECADTSKSETKNYLVVPDISSIQFFRASGYSKSKAAELFVKLISDDLVNSRVIIFGVRSKQRLRDVIDFTKISHEIYHRILLSSGTGLESELGISGSISTRDGMAIHLTSADPDKVSVFKPFSLVEEG